MIFYIYELDERCKELMEKEYVLGDLNDDEIKEVIKHEDLINASLEKIDYEHEQAYQMIKGTGSNLKKPCFFN